MLRPFNCPKSEEGWAEADQHMAAVVVPEVISATSVEEKNLALCRGIYSFFSERYGYRRLARQGRAKVTKQKSGTSLEEIKGQRNKLRNDLRRARKDGQDTEAIRSLASKFHKLLRQYSAIKRDQHRASERFNLQHCVPRSWKEGVVCLIAKPAAVQNPHAPANFRPIALTSCVGKVYTSILKNRWLSFVVGNGYLDTTTQKAFLPGVPGCVEHFQKLSAMIEDAHKKHRSLVACWLDLANAYGSVPHQLISFCLKHYNAPQSFLESVADIYDGLSAVITTKKWSTAPVSLRKGVYQGDPLSPNIGHGNLVRLSEESSSLWISTFWQ